MCHPGLPLEGISDQKAKERRWVALQLQQMQLMVAETMNNNIQAARIRGEANGGGGGGVGIAPMVVQCVCSPTRHPGSFRCRYHQGEYQWAGGRMRPSNHTGNGH